MSRRTSSENDTPSTLLIAGADADFVATLASFMEGGTYRVERCASAKDVYYKAGRQAFDVVVLDLALGERADLELVSFIRRQSPDTQIILLFDMAQVERAIEGVRQGAFFYLPRSCQPSDVALIVEKAVRVLRTQAAVRAYEQAAFEQLVGSTPAMKRVIELITKVAPTDSTVLLLGESGTGKELLANTIHRLSPRRDKAFIAINCAALPEPLLESELFGHIKGAFTGAESDKTGLFEEADGGTMFLDEVGDTSPAMQAKLLRVLQGGDIRRVGDSAVRRVDVRVLAATNRNLTEAVAKKEFREDLYFRLNVIQVVIPPLRERLDSLPALVKQLLQRANTRFSRAVRNIDEHAWGLLQGYDYPGNIRELESIIFHAVILGEGDTIHAADLPDPVRFGRGLRLALPMPAEEPLPTLQEMERRLIESALERLDGNQSEVAKRMGISRSTLWRKMKEYDIARPGDAANG